MKTKIFSAILGALMMFSCDKVTNIYPANSYTTDLNTDLFPGQWQQYLDTKWPNFDTITASTDRNILIDDFTGHNCQYCPGAAAVAHNLHHLNPERVFVSSIHASPNGLSNFQFVTTNYPVDFSSTNGTELARFFGADPNLGFIGNPAVSSSRIKYPGSTEIFFPASVLTQQVNDGLATSLKVKVKAVANYFAATKGVFLHTEVEVEPSLSAELGLIAVIQQDSLIAPQNVNAVRQEAYVHRDIYRGNVGGNTWGVTLTDALKKENGKYYVDYSFELLNLLSLDGQNAVQDANGMHLLIYVYDKQTHEVYQVIKRKFRQ